MSNYRRHLSERLNLDFWSDKALAVQQKWEKKKKIEITSLREQSLSLFSSWYLLLVPFNFVY